MDSCKKNINFVFLAAGGDANKLLAPTNPVLPFVRGQRSPQQTPWELKREEVHGHLPCLSKAVNIVHNEELGRHVRAARDIKPGNIHTHGSILKIEIIKVNAYA